MRIALQVCALVLSAAAAPHPTLYEAVLSGDKDKLHQIEAEIAALRAELP